MRDCYLDLDEPGVPCASELTRGLLARWTRAVAFATCSSARARTDVQAEICDMQSLLIVAAWRGCENMGSVVSNDSTPNRQPSTYIVRSETLCRPGEAWQRT